MQYIFYIFTFFAILSEVAAQFLFKKYYLNNKKNILYKNYYIPIGIILYSLTGYFAYKLLKYKELIVVNIIWHIFHFILLFFIGFYIFNEKLNNKKIIATIFGIISIFIFLMDESSHSHH